jgi:hypothetical protein
MKLIFDILTWVYDKMTIFLGELDGFVDQFLIETSQ